VPKVLITGANGFIGSHLCEFLLNTGYEIRALVRKTSNLDNISHLNLELCYGDITNIDSLEKAVRDVDYIIGNAGLTKTLDKSEFRKVNADGNVNLLKAVQKSNPDLKRFVLISSMAASGPSDSMTPLNESDSPRPLTAYGKSKLAGENAVHKFKDQIPITILRPSGVYGPRDVEMYSFFKAVKFRLKPTFGAGECYINFTYVKDLAKAVEKTLSTESESGSIYFITEKKFYSYSEAGDIISEIMGVKGYDIHIPESVMAFAGKITELIAAQRKKPIIFTEEKAREISQKYWIVDNMKAEKELGISEWTSFYDGASETIDWYRMKGWL
jgi:nucleoside-diphosphate-sugar epimerase